MPSAALVGGITLNVPVTPIVDAGAYSDGEALSAIMEFTMGARGGSGIITHIEVRSQAAVAVLSHLHLFDAAPSASTITKNAALVIAAADRAKNFASIPLLAADWVDCEQGGYRWSKPVYYPFNAADAVVRGVLEFDAGHTPGSTSDFIFWLGAELNQG